MLVKKIRNSGDRFTLVFFKSPITGFSINRKHRAQDNLSMAKPPQQLFIVQGDRGFMKLQHDENITLPDTVAHLAEQPLCRIVATWGCCKTTI